MTRLTIISILTLCSLTTLFAQDSKDTVFIKYNNSWLEDKVGYKTDTLLFDTPTKRHMLFGTTILPWTHNQEIAKNDGLYFDKILKSDCKKNVSEYSKDPTAINSVIKNDTALIFDITIIDNCCYSFLCDFAIVDSTTINLIYYGYGTYCFCECCFGLTYVLSKDWRTTLNPKIQYVMINGNRKARKKIK